MSLEHVRLLRINRYALAKEMDPKPVISKLISSEVLTDRDCEMPSNELFGRMQRVEFLLDILVRKADNAFAELIRALWETGQKQVAQLLIPELG